MKGQIGFICFHLFFVLFSIHYIVNDVPHYYGNLKVKNKEPESCDDFIYGCCEIYDDCAFENNTMTVKKIPLDWKAITPKNNPKGDNCPRIRNIAIDYSYNKNKGLSKKEIYQDVSSCTVDNYPINDCCKVDYNCDLRYFYDFIYYGHIYSDDPLSYQEYFNSTEASITLFTEVGGKYWSFGTCPDFSEILDYYKEIKLSERQNHWIYFHYFNVLFSSLAIIVICYIMKKKAENGSTTNEQEHVRLAGAV